MALLKYYLIKKTTSTSSLILIFSASISKLIDLLNALTPSLLNVLTPKSRFAVTWFILMISPSATLAALAIVLASDLAFLTAKAISLSFILSLLDNSYDIFIKGLILLKATSLTISLSNLLSFLNL